MCSFDYLGTQRSASQVPGLKVCTAAQKSYLNICEKAKGLGVEWIDRHKQLRPLANVVFKKV